MSIDLSIHITRFWNTKYREPSLDYFIRSHSKMKVSLWCAICSIDLILMWERWGDLWSFVDSLSGEQRDFIERKMGRWAAIMLCLLWLSSLSPLSIDDPQLTSSFRTCIRCCYKEWLWSRTLLHWNFTRIFSMNDQDFIHLITREDIANFNLFRRYSSIWTSHWWSHHSHANHLILYRSWNWRSFSTSFVMKGTLDQLVRFLNSWTNGKIGMRSWIFQESSHDVTILIDGF